jgi:hypothetical protein
MMTRRVLSWDHFGFLDWLLYANMTLAGILVREIADVSEKTGRDIIISLSNQVEDPTLMVGLASLGGDIARIADDLTE